MKTTRKGKKRTKSGGKNGMIDFNFGETLYQIDPNRKKVYHKWVEVETSKTFQIIGAYSSAQVQAK